MLGQPGLQRRARGRRAQVVEGGGRQPETDREGPVGGQGRLDRADRPGEGRVDLGPGFGRVDVEALGQVPQAAVEPHQAASCRLASQCAAAPTSSGSMLPT